jgi:hypothetical protein
MTNGKLAFRLLVLTAALMLCVLMIPRSASADDADVVTLSFTGSLSCGTSCADPITGTYSFDPDTDSIVGPWSFSSVLGSVSSTGGGAFAGTETSADQGFAGTFQLLDFVSGTSGLQLAFSGANGFDGLLVTNALIPGPTVFTGTYADPSMFANGDTESVFDVSSGFTSVVTATPEPSSILLLGLGFAGLLALGWRKFPAHRVTES